MNNKNNNLVLISTAVLFKDVRGERQYLMVKQKKEDEWELPKVTVRKGESSVRAVIRMISEQGGLSARVLEEAGRATGTAIVNSKSVNQKLYYYLMMQKGGESELIGFDQYKWLPYGDLTKKLVLKRDKEMLKAGRDVMTEWEKTHNKRLVE